MNFNFLKFGVFLGDILGLFEFGMLELAKISQKLLFSHIKEHESRID